MWLDTLQIEGERAGGSIPRFAEWESSQASFSSFLALLFPASRWLETTRQSTRKLTEEEEEEEEEVEEEEEKKERV